MDESPQGIGTLTEPGQYMFHLDCGVQPGAKQESSAQVRVKIAGTSPTLLRLGTSVNSILQAEAVDYKSYANPSDSYTSPAAVLPQLPRTDVGLGPADAVRIFWLTSNVIRDSCQVADSGDPSNTQRADASELMITLGSSPERILRLTCDDMNGNKHSLEARIHLGDLCDVTGDGVITIDDIQAIFSSRNSVASSGDLRDPNQDGLVNVVDLGRRDVPVAEQVFHLDDVHARV